MTKLHPLHRKTYENDEAVSPVLYVIPIIILMIIAATCVIELTSGFNIQQEVYTDNITIKSVDFGASYEPYYIISSNEVAYATDYKNIYYRAKDLIGSNVTLTFVKGKNDECRVIKIESIRNLCMITSEDGCK